MKKYNCLTTQRFEYLNYAVRPVQCKDIEAIRLWRNEQLNVLRQSAVLTVADQEKYYEKYVWPTMEQERPKVVLMGYEKDGSLIGYGGLVHIAWEHKRAEISFLLNPDRTQHLSDYRTEFQIFLNLMKQLAFDELCLQRLFTETYANRREHISILEEAKFKLEGRLRDHVIIEGQPTDALIHGLLKAD